MLKELANYEPKLIVAHQSTLFQYTIFYPSKENFVETVIEELNNLNISKENASTIESEIITAEALVKLIHKLKSPYINYSKHN